jgi:hypothetical protein
MRPPRKGVLGYGSLKAKNPDLQGGDTADNSYTIYRR